MVLAAQPHRKHQWFELNQLSRGHSDSIKTTITSRTTNIDFQQVKDYWKRKKELMAIENQKYEPERVATLGADLAALHFFTLRQAAVRLENSYDWIMGNIVSLAEDLPHCYEAGYCIESIDCSNFYSTGIRFEGLQYLSGLLCLKSLSFKNQKFIDSWCLDRIAGQNGESLLYLDISSCDLDLGCVHALAKMPKLTTLIIKDPEDSEVNTALMLMEILRPNLMIKVLEENNQIVDF